MRIVINRKLYTSKKKNKLAVRTNINKWYKKQYRLKKIKKKKAKKKFQKIKIACIDPRKLLTERFALTVNKPVEVRTN